MTQINAFVKFIFLCLGNLLADLAQVEKLLPSLGLILSLIVGFASTTSNTGKIAAAVLGGVSALGLALPAVIANGTQLVSDFELLWGKATGRAPTVPIPIVIPVLAPVAPVTPPLPAQPSPLTDLGTAA